MNIEATSASSEANNALAEMRSVWQSECPPLLRAYQERKLARVWDIAKSSRAYSHLGRFSVGAFQQLNVTSKAALKARPDDFESSLIEQAVKYYESTGTTGTATPTRRTAEDIAWNYGSVFLQWGEVIRPNDRCLTLLPSDIAPIGDLIVGVCEMASACVARCFPFTQGIVSWDRIEALCSRFQPTVVFASPGTLIQMMRVFKIRGTFRSCAASVNTIMLSGEVVCRELRQMLASEWDADVYVASYGSTETGTIAATGSDNSLRLLEYAYICEISTPEGIKPAEPGDCGQLVITTLNAFARPLLRFDTGDRVKILGDTSSSRKYLEILGREEETLGIGSRNYLTAEVDSMVYNTKGVTGYLLKVRNNEVVGIILEHDPDYSDRLDELSKNAARSFRDHGLNFELEIVAQLPITTKSGASLKSWKRSNAVAA
ncbi:phenylacetate--CoA ligase family protein [Bradyrhizobium sp. SZCCHNPS1003]|uniref:phenylacetate--CoA ligase family protein n=1 Tax=Bradyrhizobium sp. SZCCHNPS1003 TaxID=3057330 RepID=UPI0028F02CA2|nr:phenylacetate--CoA ligase family protein [Bradyrhizobium sp. SZCCHNPS1003]